MPQTNHFAMFIKQLRQQANLTQTAFGEKIGVGKAAVSAYEKGKTNPSEPTLERLAKEFDLSIDTLRDELTGKASLDTEFLVSTPRPKKSSIRHYPRLPIGARATWADSYLDDHDFTILETTSVVTEPGDPEKGLVVDVNGDSMEPQLRAGMRVLVEEVSPVDGWRLARPGVYVVIYRSYLVIKRIKENTLAKDGEVLLHSDNPDGGRELVHMDEIRGMWRVIRIVHGGVH